MVARDFVFLQNNPFNWSWRADTVTVFELNFLFLFQKFKRYTYSPSKFTYIIL
jgi:hypothetical protein